MQDQAKSPNNGLRSGKVPATTPSVFVGRIEYHLIAAATPRSGWSAERPRLPDEVAEACFTTIADILRPDKTAPFRRHLRLIYSQMFETELCRRAYREATLDVMSGRLPKFATLARPSLALALEDYQRLRRYRRVSHSWMVRFFRRLGGDPAVYGLLDVALRSRGSLRLGFHIDRCHRREVFDSLGAAFPLATRVIQTAMRPGRSEPVLDQLARSVAALYLDVTGQMPGRSNDVMSDVERQIEGGTYLTLCRLLAKAMNDAMPVGLRQLQDPDMVKACRRMSAELKKENIVA